MSSSTNKPVPPGEDALLPAARSLAGDAVLQVSLPDTEKSRALQRGETDRAALWHRYHQPGLHAARRPVHPGAAAFYRALEVERIEALGANRFAGVATNLDRLREHEDHLGDRTGKAGGDDSSALLLQLAGQVRQAFRHPDLPPAAVRADVPPDVPAEWPNGSSSAAVDERLHRDLPALGRLLAEPGRFARAAHDLSVGLQALVDGQGALAGNADGEQLDEPVLEATDLQDSDAAESDTDDNEAGDPDEAVTESSDREAALRSDSVVEDADEASAMAEDSMDEAPVSGRDPVVHAADTEADSYRAYTCVHDEVRRASELADAVSLARWRTDLDRHIESQGAIVRRLANRLERVLLARQRREWHYDQDEGQLDVRRLSRILTSPLSPLAFRREAESPFRDTAVTLLIDNSRSMLGRPIKIAAAAADILAQTLERCGVVVEVLGFTTTELHGGRSTEDWERAGRPQHPGRLNDLRHIIYKGADTSYRSARRDFGLMLSRDVLKQNIDGESLLWAHGRLQRRSEERRVLMVISDGAPVDTSTLAANPRDLLSRHLRRVIDDIERRSPVELLAIGIGHDVGSFYQRAITVHDARDLGPAMLGELDSLFRRAA